MSELIGFNDRKLPENSICSLCLCLVCVLNVCYILLHRLKDSTGWDRIFTTPYLEQCVERVALNSKVTAGSLGDRMLAVSSG